MTKQNPMIEAGPYVADEHGTPITGLSWCAAQPHEKNTSHCPACGVGPLEACRGRVPQDDQTPAPTENLDKFKGAWGVENTGSTIWVGPMRPDGIKVDRVVYGKNFAGYKQEYVDLALADAHLIADSVNAAIACVREQPSKALADIAAERRRQTEFYGWTPEHDDKHDAGELAAAAAAYALNAADQLNPHSQGDGDNQIPAFWPFDAAWWKPGDPRRDLVESAALILAEIEKIDRAALQKVGEQCLRPQQTPTGEGEGQKPIWDWETALDTPRPADVMSPLALAREAYVRVTGGVGPVHTPALVAAVKEAMRAALAHPQQGGERDGSGLDLTTLHAANIARQNEWCPDQHPDLSFRGNELAGETGEACNVIKKLERERQGWRGSRATLNDLAEELADVVICADLCAVTAGIDLSAAVIAKFNATSEKVGISVKLPNAPTSPSKSSGEEGTGTGKSLTGQIPGRPSDTYESKAKRDAEHDAAMAAAYYYRDYP